jgi:hypothetical protein
MPRSRSLIPVLCLMAMAATAPTVRAQSIDTLAIRAHTRFLADDALLGRGTGSAGERLAAVYIASQLERLGLRPAGSAPSFLLPIPLRAAEVDPQSRLVVTTGPDSAVFVHGRDFIMNTGGAGAFRDFRGRAHFLGQPVHAAAIVAAERSFVGRVPVFLGPLGAAAVDLVPALSHAGAAGIILLVPDSTQYDLYVRSRGDFRYFVDAAVDDPVWQPPLPVLIAGPALTEALLGDGSGLPPELIQGGATRSADLQRVVSARISASVSDVPSANIAAILPGSDPALSGQVVAYTAHYDHLGISAPFQGDSIYNGFSDNAAGVAMLLAIAEAMRDAPPARTVAFFFLSGEERGLLGSTFLAHAPPFPLDSIVALINLDAGAPPAPPISWRVAGSDPPDALGLRARELAAARGWTVQLGAASPNSDYWPFLQRGVPSIFIIPGDQWEETSTDERDALRRRWDRYHRADDHWHPDFPFAGLRRYAELALLVGLDAAGKR